jgi:hypothetical protein
VTRGLAPEQSSVRVALRGNDRDTAACSCDGAADEDGVALCSRAAALGEATAGGGVGVVGSADGAACWPCGRREPCAFGHVAVCRCEPSLATTRGVGGSSIVAASGDGGPGSLALSKAARRAMACRTVGVKVAPPRPCCFRTPSHAGELGTGGACLGRLGLGLGLNVGVPVHSVCCLACGFSPCRRPPSPAAGGFGGGTRLAL